MGYWKEMLAGLSHDRTLQRAMASLRNLYVYPDSGGRQEHIGIITRLDAAGKPTHVVHCSMGNFCTPEDAIQEAAPGVFERNSNCRLMWVDYDVLRSLFDRAPLVPPATDTANVAGRLRH